MVYSPDGLQSWWSTVSWWSTESWWCTAPQYQQQQAAVLPDGPTTAQEAQQHDDDPDGDHQVHPGQRLVGDLETQTALVLTAWSL